MDFLKNQRSFSQAASAMPVKAFFFDFDSLQLETKPTILSISAIPPIKIRQIKNIKRDVLDGHISYYLLNP